jgi:hypothetical protein
MGIPYWEDGGNRFVSNSLGAEPLTGFLNKYFELGAALPPNVLGDSRDPPTQSICLGPSRSHVALVCVLGFGLVLVLVLAHGDLGDCVACSSQLSLLILRLDALVPCPKNFVMLEAPARNILASERRRAGPPLVCGLHVHPAALGGVLGFCALGHPQVFGVVDDSLRKRLACQHQGDNLAVVEVLEDQQQQFGR